jgi:hypothetical protein
MANPTNFYNIRLLLPLRQKLKNRKAYPSPYGSLELCPLFTVPSILYNSKIVKRFFILLKNENKT